MSSMITAADIPCSTADIRAALHDCAQRIRRQKPVVHHITNFVTIYQCARVTSFIGAAPVMAFSPQESAQVTAHADALVVNTGTLNEEVVRSIPASLAWANAHNIPVVLDPVGLKLSDYRSGFIRMLLARYHFTVIRCNHTELLNLCGQEDAGKGIDGRSDPDMQGADLRAAAAAAATRYHCTIACTGEFDLVSDGTGTQVLSRGSALLPRLVGTGCMVNSLIASCLPVSMNAFEAAAFGILSMCIAGEDAQRRLSDASALGSFETFLMDEIAGL